MRPFAPINAGETNPTTRQRRLVTLAKAADGFSLAATFCLASVIGDGIAVGVATFAPVLAPVRAYIISVMPTFAIIGVASAICGFGLRQLGNRVARRDPQKRIANTAPTV